MAITFDPSTRRIVLDSTSVTATEIYSRWCDWIALSDNAKYLPAFRSTGGDDLGGGLLIPPYYFLTNDWRVRPMEANHNLTITGNLFVDGGGIPVVSTLGTFQVNVNYTVPVQAQGISTAGGGGDASWGAVVEGSLTYQDAIRILLAVAAGKTDIEGNVVKFKSLSGLVDRITATMSGSERTSVVLNPD
jgi:hypothetical protein